MKIRDDRKAHVDTSKIGTPANQRGFDRVLYDCPQCNQSHFVTVGGCPDAATAKKETAMVGK